MLEIDGDMDGDPLAAGPGEIGTFADRRVGKSVEGRQHGFLSWHFYFDTYPPDHIPWWALEQVPAMKKYIPEIAAHRLDQGRGDS
jgi:hypothetical protein